MYVRVVDRHRFRQDLRNLQQKFVTDGDCMTVLNGRLDHIHEIDSRKLELQMLHLLFWLSWYIRLWE